MDEFETEMHRFRLQQESGTLDRACEIVELEYSHYEAEIQPVPPHGPELDEQKE